MKTRILLGLLAILTISATAFADVKIKARQTMSGQSSENTTYIKGKRQRSEMMNGMMISITQCDLRRDIQINANAKTYLVNPFDDGSMATAPAAARQSKSVKTTQGGTMTITTTTKDTGERKQMFGYTARHIIQTIESESSPDSCNPMKNKMEMDSWVIDATFALDCDRAQNYAPYQGAKSGGCRDKIVSKNLGSGKSGYPLYQKMTFFDESGRETSSMIQEVLEISKATLDASLFEVPADYREAKNATDIYSAGPMSSPSSSRPSGDGDGAFGSSNSGSSSNLTKNVQNLSKTASPSSGNAGAKKEGTIRIGMAGVKTGAVGEGINAAELSAAIQNTLGEYLKGTKVELVALEAKLPSAQEAEAKEKECDFILQATVSHKKGGGGFGGMFGKALGGVISQTGIGHTGSTVGNIAGQMATKTIVAATMSANVKSKDELSLDIKLLSASDNKPALAKQYKAKAKSDGDDIISPMIEQAAQAILDAAGK